MRGGCTASSRLVIRPGAIGDTILSLPAIEYLQPDEVWVRSDAVPLIRFAATVRSIASTGIDLLAIPDVEPPPELIRKLRTFREIVSWYGANRPEFRSALCSICENVRFMPALPPANAGMHAADFFLSQAGGQGLAIAGVPDPGRSADL